VSCELLKLHISSLNVLAMSLADRELKVPVQRCQGDLPQLQNSDCLRFDTLQTKRIFSPL